MQFKDQWKHKLLTAKFHLTQAFKWNAFISKKAAHFSVQHAPELRFNDIHMVLVYLPFRLIDLSENQKRKTVRNYNCDYK